MARIDTNIDDVATAAHDQSISLQEISSSVNSLDQMTQQNAAMVEETNAISETIAAATTSLSKTVGKFKLENENILRLAS